MFSDNLSNANPRVVDWYNHIGIDWDLLQQNVQKFCYATTDVQQYGELAYPNTRWINFNESSLLIYNKGNSTNLLNVMRHFYPKSEQEPDPLNHNILIPLVNPCYSLISGLFSGGPGMPIKECDVLKNLVKDIFGQEMLDICIADGYLTSDVLQRHYPLFNETDYIANFPYYKKLFSGLVDAVLEKTGNGNGFLTLDASHTIPLSLRLIDAFSKHDVKNYKVVDHIKLKGKNILGVDFIKAGTPDREEFVNFFEPQVRGDVDFMLGNRKSTHFSLFRMTYEHWSFECVDDFLKLRSLLNNEYILCRHLLMPHSAKDFFSTD